jgi:hypothetical protein
MVFVSISLSKLLGVSILDFFVGHALTNTLKKGGKNSSERVRTDRRLTASISFRAFQCSLGEVMPAAVSTVRFIRLVHTRRLGIFS